MLKQQYRRGEASLIVFGSSESCDISVRFRNFEKQYTTIFIVDCEATDVDWTRADDGREGIKVVNAVLSQNDGNVELSCYSVPWLRSLTPATDALRTIFPNLRIRQAKRVPTLSASSLARELSPLDTPVDVWIDEPGREAIILQALDGLGVLIKARTIILRCGAEIFFEEAWDKPALEAWLFERHFVASALDDQDGDWPTLTLAQNNEARRVAELEVALTTALSEVAALSQTQAENQALTKDLGEQVAELNHINQETSEALTAARTSLEKLQLIESELSSLRTVLEVAENDKAVLQTEAQKRLEALEEEAKRANALAAYNAELEHRLANARDELRRTEGQIELIKDLVLREVWL